jgi:hypothetical protein
MRGNMREFLLESGRFLIIVEESGPSITEYTQSPGGVTMTQTGVYEHLSIGEALSLAAMLLELKAGATK